MFSVDRHVSVFIAGLLYWETGSHKTRKHMLCINCCGSACCPGWLFIEYVWHSCLVFFHRPSSARPHAKVVSRILDELHCRVFSSFAVRTSQPSIPTL